MVKDYPPQKKKSFGSLPAPRSGYATTIMVFFCSFTHLRIPRSPPKFNQFCPGPLHKISSQSVHNHLSNVVPGQTLPKTLEALRERRPPWPRHIITPILPTVKMLSLGGERLTKNKTQKTKKVLNHYLHHDLGMLPLLWWFFAHLLILSNVVHRQTNIH